MKSDTKDMKELIVSQQLTIQNLQKKIDFLQDSVNKRQEWLSKAKREAGAEISESFDNVWAEMLNRPTWEDVEKALELARETELKTLGYDPRPFTTWKYSKNEIIEQMKNQKL